VSFRLPYTQLTPPYDAYFVSPDGHVFSKKSGTLQRIGWMTKAGYERVELVHNGHVRRSFTHRLICEIYHGPPPSDKHVVAHLNGKKTDNRPENLRWSLAHENRLDDVAHRAARALRSVKKHDDVPEWTHRPSIRELVREVRAFCEYVESQS